LGHGVDIKYTAEKDEVLRFLWGSKPVRSGLYFQFSKRLKSKRKYLWDRLMAVLRYEFYQETGRSLDLSTVRDARARRPRPAHKNR